jgi:inhibitor of KinA
MLSTVVNDAMSPASTRIIDIPVCYEAPFAPDLPAFALGAGLSIEEVIQVHSAGTYFVHMLGFSPGFMYLGGLPPKLHCPRKATPATRVPAGSVAIGGEQTGIYPQSTPGGWHIIGRTPLMLFNATRQPPNLVNALDSVRFMPITAEQFEQLSRSND